MGSLSIWHWVIVLVVVLLLFGRGKISDLMGDVAKGIKSFKKGLADDEDQDKPAASGSTETAEPRPLPHQATKSAEAEKKPV